MFLFFLILFFATLLCFWANVLLKLNFLCFRFISCWIYERLLPQTVKLVCVTWTMRVVIGVADFLFTFPLKVDITYLPICLRWRSSVEFVSVQCVLLCLCMLEWSRVKLILQNVSHPSLLHLCNGGIFAHISIVSSLFVVHYIGRMHTSINRIIKVVITYWIKIGFVCVVWSYSIPVSVCIEVIILLTRVITLNDKRGSFTNTTNSVVNSCTITCTMKSTTEVSNLLHVLLVKQGK